jgi:hypothetical protein
MPCHLMARRGQHRQNLESGEAGLGQRQISNEWYWIMCPFMLISCPTCCISFLSLWRKLKIEFTRNDLLFRVRSVRFDFGPLLK